MLTTNPGAYADTYVIDMAPLAVTAPSSLESTGFPDPRVDLSWRDNSNNEDAFEVLRQGPGDPSYRFVAYLGANTTLYQDFSVIAGDLYCYQLVAHSGTAGSAPSNSSCATPGSAPAPPAAPTGLESVAFPDPRVDLSWTDSSANEISFEVRRRSPADSSYLPIATVAANVTAYQDTLVTAGDQFCYQVIARNTAGDSGPSSFSCATPPASAPTIPAAPSSLRAEWLGSDLVSLYWVDTSDDEREFLIYRRNDNKKYRRIAVVEADVVTFTERRRGRFGREYCYRVFARNPAGQSVSNEACVRAGSQLP